MAGSGSAGSLWVKLGLMSKDYENGMKQAENTMKKFGERMDTLGMRIAQGISLPLIAAGTAAVKTAADMETARVALTTLMGSASAATKQMEQLKKFSATTPFQFTELLSATRRMMAFGFQAKQTIPILRVLGNASFALGQGAEGVNNMILALGQMQMKGRAQSEELTRQLGQYVGAWQYLADYLKVDVKTAMSMVEKKMIDGGTAVKAVLAGIAKDPKFKDGMVKQAQTLAGTWSNFKDQLTFTLADIGGLLVKTFDLKNVIINVSKTMKAFSDWFAKLDPGMRKLIVYGAAAAAAFGPLLIVIGKMSLGWSALVPVFGKCLALIKALGMMFLGTAASATTATAATTGFAAAFAPFLVGGSIIAGLLTVIKCFQTIQKYHNLANANISKITDISKLQEEDKYWKEQLKKRKEELTKYSQGPDTGDKETDRLLREHNKLLSGGTLSNPRSEDLRKKQLEAAVKEAENKMKQISEARKKIAAAGPKTSDKEIQDMLNSIKAGLTEGSGAGDTTSESKVSQLSSLLSQWQSNFSESKSALLKNLDEIAKAEKDAITGDEEKQKQDLARQYKGLEKTKDYQNTLWNIENTAKNKRIKIDQDLKEQKEQIQKEMNDNLLQAQIAYATNDYQKLQLELKQMENSYNEKLASYKSQGIDTTAFTETFNLQVTQKYVEYYKQLADNTKQARDYVQELADAAEMVGKPEWFKSFVENDKTWNEQIKNLNDSLSKGLISQQEYNNAKTNADKIWAENYKKNTDEAYKSELEKYTDLITKQMQLDKDLTNEQKKQVEQRLANRLLELDPNTPEYDATLDIYKNLGMSNLASSDSFAARWQIGLSEGIKNLESFGDTVQQMASSIASGMSSAFETEFFNIFQGEYSNLKEMFSGLEDVVADFLNSITQNIAKMLANLATQQLMSLITGGTTTNSTGLSSSLVSILSKMGTGSIYGDARAAGGPVLGNNSYLVGEKGPELFVPSSSGNIISNSQLSDMNQRSGSSSSGNVSVNVINSTGTQATAKVTSKKSDSVGNQAITVVMEAVRKNTGGSRDFFRSLGNS